MPPADGTRSVAEIVERRFDTFIGEYRHDIDELKSRFDTVVIKDVYNADKRTADAESKSIRDDIAALKDTVKWVARALATAVIGGGAAAFIHR